MVIEKASIADLPAILRLWLELMDYHAALNPVFERSGDGPAKYTEFVRDLVSSKEAVVLVAREAPGARAGGYAIARVMHDPPIFARMPRGEILDVYVRPALRRRGFGSAMLEAIASWFAERGISRLEVRVYTGNPIGRSFWHKSGFVEYLETLSLEIGARERRE
jgi:GNAT superfamily N-acetyltransferase